MICDTVRRQLDALADGELSPWSAWRAHRHLAHCPGCAAAFAAACRLTERVRAWRCVSAPARLAAKSAPPPPRLRFRHAWRPALAFAGCIGAVTAAMLFLPGQPAHPTVTFADVEKAMAQVKTIHCQSLWTQYDWHNRVQEKQTTSTWAQADPPALAYVIQQLPGHSSVAFWRKNNWSKIVYNSHGEVAMGLPTAVYDVSTMSSHDAILIAKRYFQISLLGPINNKTYGFVSDAKQAGPLVNDGVVIVNGRTMLKFTRVLDPGFSTATVWIDPATNLPYREQYVDNWPKGPAVSISSNFQYNLTPPVGTFELKPPPGAHVKIVK